MDTGRKQQVSRDPMRLERQKLYEEVWLTSMIMLAKKYGLSDRGVAKICARMNVPASPRGHRARSAAGQVVTQGLLPPLKNFEKRPENHISVASADAELHPLAAKVREGLDSFDHRTCSASLQATSMAMFIS
jgi:hypothetical protein